MPSNPHLHHDSGIHSNPQLHHDSGIHSNPQLHHDSGMHSNPQLYHDSGMHYNPQSHNNFRMNQNFGIHPDTHFPSTQMPNYQANMYGSGNHPGYQPHPGVGGPFTNNFNLNYGPATQNAYYGCQHQRFQLPPDNLLYGFNRRVNRAQRILNFTQRSIKKVAPYFQNRPPMAHSHNQNNWATQNQNHQAAYNQYHPFQK